ncbi:hypothetical protein KGY77_10125 [Candidatus Bipolaricaulota bacterium]|nr:hypothetical protein [Candidatus Bipolaricaulota bacterium]
MIERNKIIDVCPIVILIFAGIALSFAFQANVGAQEVDVGDFVRSGIGGRALAMAGTYVAVGGDSSTTYWNPAAITDLDQSRFGGMYTDRFSAGIIYQYVSGIGIIDFNPQPQTSSRSLSSGTGFLPNLARGFPISGELGLGLTRISMDIGELSYSVGSPVGEARSLWFGSLAYQFPQRTIFDGLSVGGNLKRYKRTLNEDSVSGWGYDIGLIYRTDPEWVKVPLSGRVGFNFQDLGGVDLQSSQEVDIEATGVIPPYNRVGIALEYESAIPFLVSAEYDFSPTWPQLNRMSLGTEVSFFDFFHLRAGLGKWLRQGDFDYTVGAGLAIDRFCLDYAFLPHPALGATHVLSFDVKF